MSMFTTPQVVLFSRDLGRAAAFYRALGFEEVFRTPAQGPPIHVDLVLDGYRIGLASEGSTRDDHGLDPVVEGQRAAVVLWTQDAGAAYARLEEVGAVRLKPPRPWLGRLLIAWAQDPDGHLVQVVQSTEPPTPAGDPAADRAPSLEAIGHVESRLSDPREAPRQGDEGAPDAWLVLRPEVGAGLEGLQVGSDMLVLTWLHRASRDVLRVHTRGDLGRPATGVFTTRSPDRPNPVGLHRVRILAVEGTRVQVRDLEAVDGTPVIDLKPVLGAVAER